MLGVLLFFDGALLALGNVRLTSLLQLTIHGFTCVSALPCRVETASVPVWSDTYHRHTKDVLLLRSERENPGFVMFPWRHPTRIFEMAVRWVHRGDIWVLELIWVRGESMACVFGTITDLLYTAISSRSS